MAAKKRKKLPKTCPVSVKVMGKVYTVVAGKLENAYGQMDPNSLAITIDPSVEGNGNIEDTLLHELVHAAEHHAGLRFNEKWVRPISSGLLAILKDNPLLVSYLIGDEAVAQITEDFHARHAPV